MFLVFIGREICERVSGGIEVLNTKSAGGSGPKADQPKQKSLERTASTKDVVCDSN